MKVLVTGAHGLLGSTLVPYLCSRGYEVVSCFRTGGDVGADLTDAAQVSAVLGQVAPDGIVNLAAKTSVDECERRPQLAYLTNVRIVENLAKWMRESGGSCHMIQISTDQVYDGAGPHEEGDITLTNYYGFSKYAGELAVATVSSTVLRTNFFGLSHCEKRQSLTDWIFRSLSRTDGESIQVFDDVIFSPLSMATLVKMIDLVLQEKLTGVFNLGSRNGMSKADFAFAFAEELGLPTRNMTRTTTGQVNFLKAYRPKDMRMNCAMFEELAKVRLPSLAEEIRTMRGQYE